MVLYERHLHITVSYRDIYFSLAYDEHLQIVDISHIIEKIPLQSSGSNS